LTGGPGADLVARVLNRILLLASTVGLTAALDASTLYDGRLGTTPDHQGWVYLTDPLLGASATQSAAAGATTLDTPAAASDKAGYFGFGLATMNRHTGYTVSCTLQLTSESHTSNDRAGLSLIVLSADQLGVELGFWSNQIWAQNVGFTHGESATFDPTAATVSYALTIAGGTPLLSGAVRDYSAFGAPYNQSNFLFVGDDTSEAAAKVNLTSVTYSSVPEPAPILLLALALAPLAARFCRRDASPEKSR
jgi:hypothetical protein